MHDALIHAGLILLGAFIAWYGSHLGRTGKSPIPDIRIANPFKRQPADDENSAGKHQETLRTRGM